MKSIFAKPAAGLGEVVAMLSQFLREARVCFEQSKRAPIKLLRRCQAANPIGSIDIRFRPAMSQEMISLLQSASETLRMASNEVREFPYYYHRSVLADYFIAICF
jgi:hypothetical protein